MNWLMMNKFDIWKLQETDTIVDESFSASHLCWSVIDDEHIESTCMAFQMSKCTVMLPDQQQENIWDLFPQNERQVAKFNFPVISRFMMFRL